ncbi:Putative membrane protein YphA (DoxX/SURF4 family) [Paracidovorax anthurii]|uniref:Putative membrane protein YphA (DoxX/SURF4 family) n=2 Tax=Paracidovorax anthurii TaxID=78229 RepID=A0A328YTP2_9BURK|nr:putative membrane protein YphA (DoxX/SURF4 family) [Paracidovorax anthurii]
MFSSTLPSPVHGDVRGDRMPAARAGDGMAAAPAPAPSWPGRRPRIRRADRPVDPDDRFAAVRKRTDTALRGAHTVDTNQPIVHQKRTAMNISATDYRSTPSHATALNARSTDDAGKLVLRLALGVLILLHGTFKLQNGAGFIVGMLEKAGLPGVLGYLVYVGEVVAPLLVIAGIATRAGAAIIFVNMVVALGLVHMRDLFALNNQGGWALELQGMFLFGALTVLLLGAGRYSVGGADGRFN